MTAVRQKSTTDLTDLLRTKITPPRLPLPLVARAALLDRIDARMAGKLTLISAPAGYGKTTLASAWIARRRVSQHMLPVAWVALDAGDNDAVRFWRYVLGACQTFGLALGGAASELLRASARLDHAAALTPLLNDLAALTCIGILVLEDYHVIVTPQIHEQLALMLEHLPPTLHLIVLTRSDPPLPLARLRAQHALNELRADDLRFSLAETQTFVRQTLPYALPDDVIARLSARTEGWVAGLRLLTLALARSHDPQEMARVLGTVSGSHRHITAYLVAEVLQSQPESLQTFLLQTSGLSRFSAPLCDAVTERADSAAILDQLERANLFVVPLDDTGQWYRFHALFAEAMQHAAQRRLGEAAIAACAERASAWLEDQGLFPEAVEAALAARAFTRAAALIERAIGPQHFQEAIEYHTLRRWLGAVPEAILAQHPRLCLRFALVVLFAADGRSPTNLARMERLLAMAEYCWLAQNERGGVGVLRAARALIAGELGDPLLAARISHEALPWLPEREHSWRGGCLRLLGIEQLLTGDIHTARQHLLEARAEFEAAGNSYGARAALLRLGDVYALQGELHQAAELYRAVRTTAGVDRMDKGNALLGLARLAYEWNDLDTAEQQAREARDLGKDLADEPLQVQATLVLAGIAHAREHSAQAQQQLYALLAHISRPLLLREVEAYRSRLALAVGDIAMVQRWHATCASQSENIPHAQHEQETLIVARMLIAQGESAAALQLLDRCGAEAHAAGRGRRELEMLVLTALTHAAQAEPLQARRALLAALAIAQPEGYVRLFLDEGQALLELLQTIVPNAHASPLGAYARAVLYAGIEERAGAGGSAAFSPLPELLSPQERRVLQLLAAGHSNAEMAQELVVSINTVKTHVKSIYRKLNVSNRIEAYAAARRQQLL